VNLILFAPAELDAPLPRSDRRAIHILDVLRRKAGESFDVGLIDGPRGKATLAHVGADALTLTFAWDAAPPPPAAPIRLIVGLPRPQTARDILRDATTLGVAALHFVAAEKSEPGYAKSTLWSSGEWRRHALAGAEQAFDTRVPDITWGAGLRDVVASLPPASTRLALDNYEAATGLGKCHLLNDTSVTLAVGPERGWAATEREFLHAQNFALVHLGPRVLRVETAVVAALAIVRSKLGLM
jgi:RsmE family RNA methyltransferase